MNHVQTMLSWTPAVGIFASGMFAYLNSALNDSTAKFAKLQFVAVISVVCIYAVFKSYK